MANDLNPIRTEADYEEALAEVERLWGAKSGTPEGDRLDVLATLIDVYEAKHYPSGREPSEVSSKLPPRPLYSASEPGESSCVH